MEIKECSKIYNTKSSKVYSCQYHVIFSPKYRRSVLINGIDNRFKEIVFSLTEDFPFSIIDMEVMPDHVHLLIDCDPDFGIGNVVKKIKGRSSHILRNEFPELRRKLPSLWTRGKFISSVGSVSLEVVKKYIEDQKGV